MAQDAIKPLLPIAAWLDELSRVSRPVPSQVKVRVTHERAFLSSLTPWCGALGITYPASLPTLGEPATFTEAPSLAGQPALYLTMQLKHYRSGQRKHEIMNVMAKPLSDADIASQPGRMVASIKVEVSEPK